MNGRMAEVIEAFGWSLIHALWQGAIMAVVLYLVLLYLPENAARRRYRTAVTTLFMMFATWLTTFAFLLTKASESRALGEVAAGVARGEAMMSSEALGLTAMAREFVAHNLQLIVALWAAGAAVASLRFAGGYLQIQRIRRQARPAPPGWSRKVADMCRQMKISRPVQLLSSSLAVSPMVMGHLRPAVLVPVHAFTGLPAHELESLIWHELGHIARRDYLINLIQTWVEILFFFHPAVWWISARVREERECCCDNYALTRTPPLVLARALTHLQEANMIHSPKLSQAATGSGQLGRRVRRMMGDQVHQHHGATRMAASLALICSLFLLSLCTSTARGGSYAMDPAPVQQGNRTVTIHDDDQHIKYTMKGDNIVSIHVDGEAVPQEEWYRYENIFERLAERKELLRTRERELRDRERAMIKVQEQAMRNQERAQALAHERELRQVDMVEKRRAIEQELAAAQNMRRQERLTREHKERLAQEERLVKRESRRLTQEKRLMEREKVSREQREMARVQRLKEREPRQRTKRRPPSEDMERKLREQERSLKAMKEKIAQQERMLRKQQDELARQEELMRRQLKELKEAGQRDQNR